MKILIYWHDIYLPYSEYIIEAFHDHPNVESIIIAGPKISIPESIFSAGVLSGRKYHNSVAYQIETLKKRNKWAKIGAFKKIIRTHSPDLIVILDEALSVNVFNAGLANRLANNHGKVLFYGFENILQNIPWRYLLHKCDLPACWMFLRKSSRYLIFDRLLHPIRIKLIHGGVVCYKECHDMILNFGWHVPVKEQWWGVSLDKFTTAVDQKVLDQMRQALNITPDHKILGFVGRFVPEKGVMDLVKVLSLLDDKWILLLVGDGTQSVTIEQTAHDMKVRNQLRLIAPVSQVELAVLYRLMNVLALPSHTSYFWKEQYGRVLVEAMACGIKTIGSDSGAIPFVIGDHRFIFHEGDISDIAEKVDFAYKFNADEAYLRARAQKGDVSAFVSSFISFYDKDCL